MRNVAKLILVALVAVMCVTALAATGASAEEPLFGTLSGKALSFTGTSGTVTLRGKEFGVEGTITCEKESVNGLVLNESTLARELHIELKGKCEETIGSTKNACTEPIKSTSSSGELGLLSGHVLLYVAPESGTEFAKITCGSFSTKVNGAIVGEFTLNGRNGQPQYAAHEQKDYLLVFKDKGVTQEPEEIELLGAKMTGVTLKAEGFGEKVAEEALELLESAGYTAVLATTPYIYNPVDKLDFKTSEKNKTVEVRNDKFKNVKITKAEVNPNTYFKEPGFGSNTCNGIELKKYFFLFSDEVTCGVKIEVTGTAKAGELAKLDIVSPVQNDDSYLVESKT